jgi:DNA repair photolyase
VWLEHLLSGEATIFCGVIYNSIIEFIFITRFKGKRLERWLFSEIERREETRREETRREKREERREKREERREKKERIKSGLVAQVVRALH